jgi:glycosyltransferase involved in cell wall biosynthesis
MPSFNNKSIHILQIASGDNWAGAEVMLYTLAKTLHSKPDTLVSAVILNHGTLEQKLRDCGITVFVIDETQLNSFQLLQQLNKIVNHTKPDVIHTHRTKENILGSLTAWRNGRIPSLRTLHGSKEHHLAFHQLPKRLIQLLDWLSGRVYKRNILAVSSVLATQLKNDFPESKITLIENGIDIAALSPSSLPAHAREDINHYRIGIVGRLVPVKRVDLFIKCAAYLKQHYTDLDIDFYIYGDGPLKNQLQTQVKTEKAEAYIHFKGHCDNIPQQLQTLDALMMTSDHEGLPMVLLEAMCLNTVIIAHAVGGIPDLLDQGKCGVLIDNQSVEAFAEAIVNLTRQPKQHRQLAQQAFEQVKKNYSADRAASQYLKLYKQLLT